MRISVFLKSIAIYCTTSIISDGVEVALDFHEPGNETAVSIHEGKPIHVVCLIPSLANGNEVTFYIYNITQRFSCQMEGMFDTSPHTPNTSYFVDPCVAKWGV